jgi:hypothetical protein
MDKFRPSIKHGLTMGVISIVVFLLQYALMPDSFGNLTGWMVQLVVFFLALPIVFMILGARDSKANFGFYSYGNALMGALSVGLVSAIVVLLFNLVFMYAIDPDFDNVIKEQVMSAMEERFENANMSDEQIKTFMEQQEAQFEKNKGLLGKLMQTGFGLVWYLILALIIAAIYRDKQPKDLIA